MQPFKSKRTVASGPEQIIQNDLIKNLKGYDWYVKVMIGNHLQFGVPDLYAAHRKYGQRWIEVKNPKKFSFTEAQCREFPLMDSAGVGIWVLFAADDDEIAKLHKPANWFEIMFKFRAGITSR